MLSACGRASPFQVFYPQTVLRRVNCIKGTGIPVRRFCVNCPAGRVPKPESWLAPSARSFPWRLPTVQPLPPGPLNLCSSPLCAGHRSYGRENIHFLRISLGLSELTLAVYFLTERRKYENELTKNILMLSGRKRVNLPWESSHS